MVTKRQKIVEEMQEKDKERRKKQPKRKYHGRKGHTVPDQESWHHPLPEGYKEGSTKGKKSTVGGGKQGVKTVTPEHMKPPKKKSKSSTKKTRKGSPTGLSFTEKVGIAQDIGPWKPTDRKATKPKVSYKKPKKTPWGMKKGGSVKKKSKSSTVGGGKQGVKTVTPKHMKAPPAKRTKGTKAAPHMVKHSMGSLTGITTAEDWSKMRKMDAELDREWEKAVPSSYQGKGHGRKVVHGNKGAHRKRKGGSVDAQWGGYDFKDGGRIPGIRPTRKGT